MRWLDRMADSVRSGIRSFLQISPPQHSTFHITERLDYYGNAAVNRIWVRGDADELQELYCSLPGTVSRVRFWAAASSAGNEINKLHTGIPSIMRKIITHIVISDMGAIRIDGKWQQDWKRIENDNHFKDLLEEAIKEILTVGDGAFKISFEPRLTDLPIIEFIPGDRLEYIMERGRVKAIIFRTAYTKKEGTYIFEEEYGLGYIRSRLLKDDKDVGLAAIPETKSIQQEILFQGNYMMAVKFLAFKSDKYRGRGAGIFDTKADALDALDESWSQWMDALRRGHSKEYIPENMLPRDPYSGEIMPPNPFDHAYIKVDKPMTEGASSEITISQPTIPHESYLSTYCNALDLALQGVLSPSTLGIDVKKLDNAEAQREKEKVTLYTRNKLVQSIQDTIPQVVDAAIKAYCTWTRRPIEEIKAEIPFGEYANPSFESQVETVGKGKTQGIMSIEACVEELYGASKDEEWKTEEVMRLKKEQGIVEVEEPSVNTSAGGFSIEAIEE